MVRTDRFRCGNGDISRLFAHRVHLELSLKVVKKMINWRNVYFKCFFSAFCLSVTRCRFSQHGNKFGIADGDGKLSLWQVGLASQCNRSFFVSRSVSISDRMNGALMTIRLLPLTDSRVSQQAHHRLHVSWIVQLSRNRFVIPFFCYPKALMLTKALSSFKSWT